MDNLQEQLISLHAISAEIAGLHEFTQIHDRALGYCLDLTDSRLAFTGLLRDTGDTTANGRIRVNQIMDVAAIRISRPAPSSTRLLRKLDVGNRVQAALKASKGGWL